MRKYALALLLACGLAGLVSTRLLSGKNHETASANVSKGVADFCLKDTRGQDVVLSSFKDRKAVVVLFLGTQCPINNVYIPRLAELQKEYEPRGVQFLGVNSNQQDDAQQVAEHARQYEIPFPVLKDDGNHVADLLGAQRTPEAVVLDSRHMVRYRGRIDDQFGVGFKRSKPTRRDLASALDEVLAGKPVSEPATSVAGCYISRAVKSEGDSKHSKVTYTREVVRIMQKNCQECHRPGRIGPMSLLTYEDVAAWSDSIREVVAERRMPPWFADPHVGKWLNDRSLCDAERDTLLAWIDQGCPQGDLRDMPPPREFVPGWSIGKPDVVFTMKDEFEVPAVAPKNGIEYQYFEVDTGFTEDKWVQCAEAKEGAPSVVHHIIVFIVAPDRTFIPKQGNAPLLCGTAPGDMPLIITPGNAKKIPRGSKLVFQVHYTASGKATRDRSSVGIIFAKEPPKRELRTLPVMQYNLHIPPGADNYEAESTMRFNWDNAYILAFMPHMHLRGKDIRAEVIYPDNRKETVFSIPHYNFNWQSSYRLQEPISMPKGSKIHFVAHFDNSAKNPNNPDPTKTVRWGDQTWEEMMIGWTDVAVDIKPPLTASK